VKACQVVPDIPSFAVDDGFSYMIPEGLDVRIGSRVRIRVSGRRMKGFVTAIFEAPSERTLLPLDGVSGTLGSFDGRMLPVLRWAATHYVSPMSTILKRTVPPNIPRLVRHDIEALAPHRPAFTSIISDARSHARHVTSLVERTLGNGESAMVVVPSVHEANAMASALRTIYGDAVVLATSASEGKEATRTWGKAANRPPAILVGTRETMLWPVARLGIGVVVEDGRRVMKSPSTPTLGVREVLIARARAEGFDLALVGPVPTLETIATGATVVAPPARQWPLVEVVDRSHEPPSRTVVLERTSAAISAAVRRREEVFVLVPSRGYAPAFRCISCGELRRCTECDTAASRTSECRRCGAELGACTNCGKQRFEPLGAGIGSVRDAIARSVRDDVGVAGDGKLVTVGSERDLIGFREVALAVAVDIDGMAHAPTYRASEDAFRLLVRLAQLVQKGKGNRLMVQTAAANQPIVAALRSGRSGPFLEDLMKERRALMFPPHGQLIALEIDRAVPVGDTIVTAIGDAARVLGPAPMRDRDRWLIQGRDLTDARIALRSTIGVLRDKGARVRIDVDPIDL
jgi:primosomal protein N' (replication factor Y) (superfamily II helicase)